MLLDLLGPPRTIRAPGARAQPLGEDSRASFSAAAATWRSRHPFQCTQVLGLNSRINASALLDSTASSEQSPWCLSNGQRDRRRSIGPFNLHSWVYSGSSCPVSKRKSLVASCLTEKMCMPSHLSLTQAGTEGEFPCTRFQAYLCSQHSA